MIALMYGSLFVIGGDGCVCSINLLFIILSFFIDNHLLVVQYDSLYIPQY